MSVVPAKVEHPRVRAWLEIREPLERQLRPLGHRAMDALDLRPGERVLDLGCGVGGTPRALAEAVGAAGRVVAMDLLEPAIEVLRAEGDAPNLTFLCGDAETWPFEPGAFDAVFSRFGAMFFAKPTAAFRNIGSALRPGGRLGFVCWRGIEDNELDHLPLRAASPHLPAELVEATAGSAWFSLSEPQAIQATLRDAGFVGIGIQAHDVMVGCGGLEATVDVCSRVGALGAILRQRPELTASASRALRAALGPRDGPEGPLLRAAIWTVTARRPEGG